MTSRNRGNARGESMGVRHDDHLYPQQDAVADLPPWVLSGDNFKWG